MGHRLKWGGFTVQKRAQKKPQSTGLRLVACRVCYRDTYRSFSSNGVGTLAVIGCKRPQIPMNRIVTVLPESGKSIVNKIWKIRRNAHGR